MDHYEAAKGAKALEIAESAAEYILKELYWKNEQGVEALAYPTPSSKAIVHNANFLGAAVLCRAYRHNGNEDYLDTALKIARFSTNNQCRNGSWQYGKHATQKWVDNFHTGYNLVALKAIGKWAETSEFDKQLRRGYEFYLNNFFTPLGEPKYYHNRLYPIDTHSVAQSIITLLDFNKFSSDSVVLAEEVLKWALDNLWDEKGFFYYQIQSYYKNKISYMRWSQAWMLYALAVYLENKI